MVIYTPEVNYINYTYTPIYLITTITTNHREREREKIKLVEEEKIVEQSAIIKEHKAIDEIFNHVGSMLR